MVLKAQVLKCNSDATMRTELYSDVASKNLSIRVAFCN